MFRVLGHFAFSSTLGGYGGPILDKLLFRMVTVAIEVGFQISNSIVHGHELAAKLLELGLGPELFTPIHESRTTPTLMPRSSSTKTRCGFLIADLPQLLHCILQSKLGSQDIREHLRNIFHSLPGAQS